MQECDIQSIDSGAFEGLTSLAYLFFFNSKSYNNLKNCFSVFSKVMNLIPSLTIYSTILLLFLTFLFSTWSCFLVIVSFIDLSENSLKYLPNGAFSKLSVLTELLFYCFSTSCVFPNLKSQRKRFMVCSRILFHWPWTTRCLACVFHIFNVSFHFFFVETSARILSDTFMQMHSRNLDNLVLCIYSFCILQGSFQQVFSELYSNSLTAIPKNAFAGLSSLTDLSYHNKQHQVLVIFVLSVKTALFSFLPRCLMIFHPLNRCKYLFETYPIHILTL